MKYCTKCETDKSRDSFSKNARKKDGLQSRCKECASIENAETYRRLPQRRRKIRETNKVVTLRNREFLNRVRRRFCCQICGENEPVALDFHHLDPLEKDTEVPRLVSYSRDRLKVEIRKCAILCSNCHRKHHAGLPGFKL